jgi:dolichol-phosphate mannosyltransferase
MSYSLILPTYNEKNHIIKLINELINIIRKTKKKFEIIIIDDNSKDGTAQIIKKKFFNKKFVKISIRKEKNSLVESLNLGIKKSKYKNIIWMDADFQHPPYYVSKLIELEKKFDLIICSRFLKESKRHFDKEESEASMNDVFSIYLNKICNFLLYKEITDYTSGFILIKKKIFFNYKLRGYYGDYFINLIHYCKNKQYLTKEIPFIERKRLSGQSKTSKFGFDYFVKLFFYFYCVFKIYIKNLGRK